MTFMCWTLRYSLQCKKVPIKFDIIQDLITKFYSFARLFAKLQCRRRAKS